jgi:hypothetical protein
MASTLGHPSEKTDPCTKVCICSIGNVCELLCEHVMARHIYVSGNHKYTKFVLIVSGSFAMEQI